MADLGRNEASHLSLPSLPRCLVVVLLEIGYNLGGREGNKRVQAIGPPGWGLDYRLITYLHKKQLSADRRRSLGQDGNIGFETSYDKGIMR